MSLPTHVREHAATRFPIELWEEILNLAFPICIRPDDPTWAPAPLSLPDIYAMMEHTSAWPVVSEEYKRKQLVLQRTGVNQYHWSLRLVCRFWNDYLLPLLFHTIRVDKHVSDVNASIRILKTKHGAIQYGQYVRCLVLDMPNVRALRTDVRDDLQHAINTLMMICPGVETVHYERHVLLPQLRPGLPSMRNVRYISLPDSPLHMAVRLAAGLPKLEVLDLMRYEARGHGVIGPIPGVQQVLPKLTHLSSTVNEIRDPGPGTPSLLAQYDMPCLRYLYITVPHAVPFPEAEPFFRAHGARLSSLVLSFENGSRSDDGQLIAASFCPNLEEFVTDLPYQFSTRRSPFENARPCPRLARLRTFSARGFTPPHWWKNPGGKNIQIEDYTNSTRLIRAFLLKLTVEATPNLEVVKVLDMPDGPEARKVLAGIGTMTCVKRGVRFEDAMGKPITASRGGIV